MKRDGIYVDSGQGSVKSQYNCVDGRKMFKFNGGNVERTIYETVFLQLTVWVDGL